ncbi:MAG: FAD-dependent oxidoreductase [Myxococcales bacterium]|nr:FAD-dependent oxidoreductase [Myxococcales bacterium]MCH7867778.1 FAD-dependent oxidoreductase [Myxococcales bacterium]
MALRFPNLFSPLRIRNLTLKNRIGSSGHDTCLADHTLPGDAMVAYHRARAKGGAGLIVLEVSGVHESARYTAEMMLATHDDCIPGFRRIAEAVHEYDCVVIGQLFHPGREILSSPSGTAPVAYSSSDVPNERFHVTPRAVPKNVIQEIVQGFGQSAARLVRAGLDGVEIVASHGYLPDQFMNPRVNQRTDEYGGSLDNRLRFLRECIESIRANIGDRAIGLRISGSSWDSDGLQRDEILEMCAALDGDGEIDYYSVTAGSSASIMGSIHIAPPMGSYESAYVAPDGKALKAVVSKPVMVTGRITTPGVAEQIISRGEGDICGMTRAMICDEQLANKALEDRADEIRECIGCNQACIGHMHVGAPISCIQHPESGRELIYGERKPAKKRRRIMVVGGGPGGMKAAAVAAERGHDVTLYEATEQLGGQALLAQQLPGRGDFGGLITNLNRELEQAGVRVITKLGVDVERIRKESPDAVILATGARPRTPEIEQADDAHVLGAWEVISGQARPGTSVVVADWRCDWIGLGLAELLARDGCRVRLCVNGMMPGETIQQYVRDPWLGTMHKLGVEVIPLVRLAGVDSDTVYFEHTLSGEPLMCEEVDTLVHSLGHVSVNALERELQASDYSGNIMALGDCVCPRTAEEAVLEGLELGSAV